MTLLTLCLGSLLLKGLTELPFAYSKWRAWLVVACCTILLWAPLLKVLYHETQLDFFSLFLMHLVVEMLLLRTIVRLRWWKAVLASMLYSSVFFLYFLIGNG